MKTAKHGPFMGIDVEVKKGVLRLRLTFYVEPDG